MNIAALLRHAATAQGDRPAVSAGFETWVTYARLAERVARLAAWLRAAGLAPGDRLGIAMTNCPQYFEVLFAAWHAGLTAVPINAKLHRSEFEYILGHSGAKACFVTPAHRETIEGLQAKLESLGRVVSIDDPAYEAALGAPAMDIVSARPEDPAWLFYTSGTTGRPKGATLTHRNLMTMTLAYFADIDQVGAADSMIHAAPLSHGSGLYSLSHFAKAANNVIPASGGFEPREIFALVDYYPGTSFFAAPTMITRLLNDPGAASMNLEHLKTINYGGGPMYVSDLERALSMWGPRLYQLYGQGEAPMTITGLSKAQHAAGDSPRYREWLCSVGFPRTAVEVRIADEDDNMLPAGQVGEVLVRGDVVMAGYWQNPEATAATLRGGWLHTGDVGMLDASGFLTLKDRSKDMIISGGSNIYPREIEEVLLRHASVLEASVVGRRHPEWGEEVVAFVVPCEGAVLDEAALDRLCLESIARFKRPKAYFTVDSLPKNNYGKILKTELRKRLERT